MHYEFKGGAHLVELSALKARVGVGACLPWPLPSPFLSRKPPCDALINRL
ncbi:hypothetical protein SAMN04488058_1137 [Deinococcus reticulitermitis]|uniref:Uncharacterized protein n=1 Tax=Deinococcus reticulitermitis TaxID=856736 RepID=A0A1H7ASV0_9DEIO|nr:hypothetical protein SAMN04488058_1137 [Deinococcus reticulitermitis]